MESRKSEIAFHALKMAIGLAFLCFTLQTSCTSGLEPEKADTEDAADIMSSKADVTPEEKAIYQGKLGKAANIPDNQLSGYDVSSGKGVTWALGGYYNSSYGYEIWRYSESQQMWEKMPGYAVCISVDNNGYPWVANKRKQIWQWKGTYWERKPGLAIDVGCGSGSSSNVFVVGIYNRVWKWNNGWALLSDAKKANKICAVNYHGPMIVDIYGILYSWSGSSWLWSGNNKKDISEADPSYTVEIWTVDNKDYVTSASRSYLGDYHGATLRSIAGTRVYEGVADGEWGIVSDYIAISTSGSIIRDEVLVAVAGGVR